MRVVLAARVDLLSRKGGDTIQILKTKEALERLYGVDVQLCLDPASLAVLAPVDVVHVFNLQTTDVTLEFVRAARAIGSRVALSTVYWNLWHAAVVDVVRSRFPSVYLGYVPLLEGAWRFFFHGRSFKRGFLGREYVSKKRDIVSSCDLLFPNSPEELEAVCADTFLPSGELAKRAVVVPNAADLGERADDREVVASRRAVAMVGRIEPIKNQLAVLNALSAKPDVPVLVIGRRSNDPKHEKYCEDVFAAGHRRGNVQFIDEIPHAQVSKLLATAKVHVLASFRESPGLVTLEALFAGCNIVTSSAPYCPIDYYRFAAYGSQCNPFSVASIREAILAELDAPSPDVDANYFEKFSYENVARGTYGGYRRMLGVSTEPMPKTGCHSDYGNSGSCV